MTDCEKRDLVFGIKRAAPIVLGYVPVGFALGVLAANAGLTPLQAGMMSLLVYAGSAQFIAVSMLSAAASYPAIIATTFLVNLRHLLFSASLSPYFKEISRKLIPFISFFITDESFAVSITDLRERNLSYTYLLGLYVTSYLSWVLSTVMGAAFGNLIPDTKALGFDFALPGMFMALLCMQIKDMKAAFAAVLAGTLSVLFLYVLPGSWNVILASIITAMIGVLMEK
ncbi:Inner membrane protein YgaZ [Fervidicola ferrireducens]|uniref:Inner membrane protein YgaZ n=1 Tax=Fervidicola ferrireducens TaxID=520764 RepID=A0A140L3V8_9FIRM|nr:AzlC family ABC transporter permease [Fervidicola ferrireducens]KXG75233.1 Inner membrane protein YgaZ [Fervidicola ferrireducens]